jgi:signal transduction histidine kinase
MTSASDELELPADSALPVAETRRGHDVEEEGVDKIENGARGPLMAPLMARAIVGTAFLMQCLFAFTNVLLLHVDFVAVALSVCYLLMLVALQVFYFTRPGINLRSPLTYGLLAVQACLVYLPIVYYGQSWTGMPLFLAGTALLVLPPVAAWTVFVAVIASQSFVQWGLEHDAVGVMFLIVASSVVAFEVYGLTRLAGLVTELHAARTELATVAVAHQRLRFARDLHDLLGQSLSAIAPKGELAHRLVRRNPERARQELSEILDISRRALADVRAVAHGYREVSLEEESTTAESVLASSRVEVRMERNLGEMPAHVRTLLAAVLREGVANVLDHSDAERCEVIMRQSGERVALDIVNDGVDPALVSGPYEGSKLTALAERVTALDGELRAGLDANGRFHLRLTVPVSRRQDPPARTEEDTGEPVPETRVRLGQAVMTVVFIGIGVISALRLAALVDLDTQLFQYAVSVGYLLMMLAIQLFYFSRPTTRLRQPTSYALLVVQACLVHLPALQFGVGWQPLAGFLAGSAVLVLPPVLGWSAFGAVMVSAGSLQAVHTGSAVEVVNAAAGIVINGLVAYGLTWMVRSMTELRAARVQLAHTAVAEERLRFARDLHDLLGLSLSAITLKTELAHRLVTAAPEKAREELTEILAISRLALADVRLVASGYRELSLDEEFQAAESLLVAADVDVKLDVNYGELPSQVGTLLATVLREGVTNVLRHSKGERCEITVQRHERGVCMEIVNDGVPEAHVKRTNGSGIDNLSFRVALLGGELTAGLEPDGRFRLRARVPA